MNLPMNYNERIKLVDRMTNNDLFTFKELLELKEGKMLEYGDLFIIDKNGEYWFSIVYLDGKWVAVTGDYKLVEISEKELSQYKFYNRNLFNSPYQDYIKREGKENFERLSIQDKCDVFCDNYFKKRINQTLDGLIETLEKVVKEN